MNRLLPFVLCVAMAAMLAAPLARAGSNAGGTAYLYWLTGNTVASADRNSFAATPRCLVTVKGVSMFRGADVQLYLNSLDWSGLPPAWQAEDGGPASANFAPKIGGWNAGSATMWPNIFKASPPMPGEFDVVPGTVFYQYAGNPHITPHNVGAIWMSAAGSVGVARTPSTEYGVFGFTFSLDTGLPGDLTDPDGPIGVCINPNWRITSFQPRGNVMVVVDASATKDYEVFDTRHNWLTWAGTGWSSCPYVTPASNTTWGKVRKLYH